MSLSKNDDHRDTPRPFDLSKWRKAPMIAMVAGVVLILIGFAAEKFHGEAALRQFGFSWLQSFMFYLSLCVGGLFLVLAHHMFDAAWSVPIRRVCEHIACLFLPMLFLFIPIGVLAPKLYKWMAIIKEGGMEHAIKAKYPLFTIPGFYISAALCFAAWIILSWRLRSLSLQQDKTGAAAETYKMRVTTGIGIFFFAITVTLAAIMWMKALEHEWFSTMYGVQYFAGSVWTTLATIWLLVAILKRQGPLREVVREKQFYYIGSLLFAFTVFYAYVSFSQYFIIWNANMPEETFWYLIRERGSWDQIGKYVIIFGHFFVPFLTLLRIDVKQSWTIMIPLAVWAWLMQFVDMAFNVGPAIHTEGFVLHWMDLGSMALIGGVLATFFLKWFNSHPPFPQRDPRMAEALDIYMPPAGSIPAVKVK